MYVLGIWWALTDLAYAIEHSEVEFFFLCYRPKKQWLSLVKVSISKWQNY